MAYWIYKCNSRRHPHQVVWGDWNDFFSDDRPQQWGSTEWVPALSRLASNDFVLAYQTDRNELVGTAIVVRLRRRGEHLDVILRPLTEIRQQVRPLKKANKGIAKIPALQSGPIKTVYEISERDAKLLIKAATTKGERE